MVDQGAAAENLAATVINGQEYLAAATDDVTVDVGESVQVGFLQPEPVSYPFSIEPDEIGLVPLAVCRYLNQW